MKKTRIILMAFALAMTMSQCKKNSEQPTANDEVVTITLDVNQNDGTRVIVNPATGTVDFESGDKIYVGSGGKYVGFLTHNGTNFSGNITNPTENQPLQFYFLGNVTLSETLSAGITEECSVIISDQTEHLPVISCAASNEDYVSGVTAYSAHLLNKCALVKFNVTTPSNAAICITGMKNKVTVDFVNNTLTPSQDGEGVIMLPAGAGENVEKWAILLPQQAVEEGLAYSVDGNYSGTHLVIPIISENAYLANGIAITVNTPFVPVGAINGLYSVSATKKVYFSQGNLQYQASTNTWQFADNQWEYIGENNSNISDTYDGLIDLFGWGTSNWNNGNVYYHPYDYQMIDDVSQGNGYGPTNGSNYQIDLVEAFANADWGIFNSISNGSNHPNQWRTLTKTEWEYILNERNTSFGVRYAMARVNNVNGIILLPDNWNVSVYSLNNTNQGIGFTNNIITATDWNTMESYGAVFLPTSGTRHGIRILDNGVGGRYWSVTHWDSYYAYSMSFSDDHLLSISPTRRYYGCSVRLVQDY